MYSFKKFLQSEPAALAGIVSAVIAVIALVIPVAPAVTGAIVTVVYLVLSLAYVRPRVTPMSKLAEPDADETE